MKKYKDTCNHKVDKSKPIPESDKETKKRIVTLAIQLQCPVKINYIDAYTIAENVIKLGYIKAPDTLPILSDEEIRQSIQHIYSDNKSPQRFINPTSKEITWAFKIADAIAQAQRDADYKRIKREEVK